MVVGRDVIVPVINAKNPFIDEIESHGISPEVLSAFLKKGNARTWDDLLKNGKSNRADYFCIGNESAQKNLAIFFKTDIATVAGTNSADAEEVISGVGKNPYAIGFCRLTDVMDPKTQTIKDNLRLLPLDRNGNGLIDYSEKIYDNANTLARGVWIGKYPKALFNNIYTVAKVQPENIAEIAFIKWVITDGQKYLSVNGYSDLLASERMSSFDNLNNAGLASGASAGQTYIFRSVLIIAAVIILAFLIAASLSKKWRRGKSIVRDMLPSENNVLDINSLQIPKGIYFDKTHTWAFLEENGTVRVGVDDFMQHITGKITRIKMKEPGRKVKKGEQILSLIQNGKHLYLYAPVSGTIVEQNESLVENAAMINSSPYNQGWIYRIDPSGWSRESQLLFMSEKHREFLKLEFSRLKDFLMNELRDDEKYTQVLLQDGGEISDGVLSEMGPEIWEDFQSSFIDPSRQVWFYEMF